MSQPVPKTPTNVQITNVYEGQDRGLFLIRNGDDVKWGRIHAAKLKCLGPSTAVGVLEYQVKQYDEKPETDAAYQGGTILTAPGGGQWFDCLTRGAAYTPIVVEYWATESYLKWYREEGGVKLTTEEKTMANEQAKTFANVSGSWAGLTAMTFAVGFATETGKPLRRISMVLSIDFTKNNKAVHQDITVFPNELFDPIRVALEAIRNA